MEQSPDDATLGALGFAGICRETLRVISSRPPYFLSSCGLVIMLSFSLLAHVAVSRVLFSYAVTATSDANGTGFVRLAANWALFLLGEAAFLLLINFLSGVSALLFVISVAPRYFFAADAGHDARSAARDLRALPRSHAKYLLSVSPGHARLFARLNRTDAGARFDATARDAFLLLLGYTALFGAAALLMHLHRAALLLVGGTAYLAGAAYIVAVWHVACVLSILEDGASGFRAMHRSDELLTGAGKFWAAAAVFTTLDSYAVAVQLAFGALVMDNRMGLGVWVRVAAGVAMAAALWATVMSGLVVQVVVYFVCKGFHRHLENSDGTTAKSLVDVGRRGRAIRNNRKRQ
uniref:Uncharacterized protein n=1 Tax=Avena sativa TaxID=4498 RepID=A0ACD5ZCH4_AVESA